MQRLPLCLSYGNLVMELLTRYNFREQCLIRDNNRCVVCKSEDSPCVHHIIERRLFEDGGYWLENGATVCPSCHIKAEQTLITVEELKLAIKATERCVPKDFYKDEQIDKWGNCILPNGMRMRGPLFDDLSVRKILEPVLHLFTKYIKYPKTSHLPWSPNVKEDDRTIHSDDIFKEKEVIVSLKMDGENCSIYNDYVHARSIDSRDHISRHWIKNFQSRIGYNIPDGWRVCGENMWAKHSILYDNLPTYFLGFSVWNENNICLKWDETLEWFELMGITPVEVFYRDIYNREKIQEIFDKNYSFNSTEGYVIRLSNEFHYRDFSKCTAKFVRKNHVEEHGFWMSRITQNKLRKDE